MVTTAIITNIIALLLCVTGLFLTKKRKKQTVLLDTYIIKLSTARI